MNEYNRKIINKRVLEYAPLMQPRLPEHPSHPGGRRAYAHMYDVLKSIFGKPIAEVGDDRLEEALEILKFCLDNAETMSICSKIRHLYPPEPDDEPASLDSFFT